MLPKVTLEAALKAELDVHLDFDKHEKAGFDKAVTTLSTELIGQSLLTLAITQDYWRASLVYAGC